MLNNKTISKISKSVTLKTICKICKNSVNFFANMQICKIISSKRVLKYLTNCIKIGESHRLGRSFMEHHAGAIGGHWTSITGLVNLIALDCFKLRLKHIGLFYFHNHRNANQGAGAQAALVDGKVTPADTFATAATNGGSKSPRRGAGAATIAYVTEIRNFCNTVTARPGASVLSKIILHESQTVQITV